MIEGGDYLSFYKPVARNITAGRGITLSDNRIATFRPPGYPFLLAATFKLSDLLNLSEEAVISVFILLCMGLSSVFLFLLAQSMWGRTGAIISSIIWMTNPCILWLTKQPNVELPFFVIFYGSVCLFFQALYSRKQNKFIYFASGILIGCAMLIRPIAIGIGVIMAGIIWFIRRNIKAQLRLLLIIILLVGNLMSIFPWELWVYSKTNKIIPLGTVAHSSIYDGLTYAVNLKNYRLANNVSADVRNLMLNIKANGSNFESTRAITFFLVKEFQRRPLAVAKLLFIKALRSWYATDSQRFEQFILPLQIAYLIFILWGSWIAYHSEAYRRELTIGIWVIGIYFWIMTTLALSIVRYMLPAMGLLFIFIPGFFLAPRTLRNKNLNIDTLWKT
jgi:F0F1-type ATP synthase membrane subunit c/vacuolar-type H+-ATPase subunit K